MEAHVCMRKKVAGYIFPVQLSSRVVLQLLIRRIYKLLDAYTGYAEFFFLLVIGVGCAEATGCARSWLQACYVLGIVSGTKKRHDKNEWLHELLHSEQYKCIKTYKND